MTNPETITLKADKQDLQKSFERLSSMVGPATDQLLHAKMKPVTTEKTRTQIVQQLLDDLQRKTRKTIIIYL